MEPLQFIVQIDASAEDVYHTLIDPEHFKSWSSVFNPSSRFEGNWNLGSKMLFLSTAEDGTISGLISEVKTHIPVQQISLQHYGLVQNGIEITTGKLADAVRGATESYYLSKLTGSETELRVQCDVFLELREYFLERWPQALHKIQRICETSL